MASLIGPREAKIALALKLLGVQRIVEELGAEGFVELKDTPHHRSAKLVVMTAKGEQAYEAALQLQAPWVNRLAEGLDRESIEVAGKVLDALRQRLEQPSAEGGHS